MRGLRTKEFIPSGDPDLKIQSPLVAQVRVKRSEVAEGSGGMQAASLATFLGEAKHEVFRQGQVEVASLSLELAEIAVTTNINAARIHVCGQQLSVYPGPGYIRDAGVPKTRPQGRGSPSALWAQANNGLASGRPARG